MKTKSVLYGAMLASSVLGVVALSSSNQPASATRMATTAVANMCGVQIVRTEAMDAPEKHAWDLFMILNHPAKDIKTARGEPDCSKSIGAPGTTSVWETWRLARTEVFLDDGSEPPEWGDTSLPNPGFGKTPDPMPSPHNPPAIPNKTVQTLLSGKLTPRFDPETDQGVFVDHGGIGETHVNKATYDFIKQNCLWSFDGLSRYSKAVVDGKKPPISFPLDSIEAKAVWVTFTPADVAAGRQKTYYTATVNNVTYGLVALHVLTKDMPTWFWATFHHKDDPVNPDEIPSKFPQPKALAGTVWENYVLGGTQTDFVTPTGSPTILSDYFIENNFTHSSCMTCHANAHGNPEPARTPDGKLQRDPEGSILAAGVGPQPAAKVGTPLPDKFEQNGKQFFVQNDFVWSIPFRAREEQKPPPARCLF